jgi:glyoxylase-like metal-dependent hydrolase (beta-lactamase superfamily II)
MSDNLIIEHILAGPIQTNLFVVGDRETQTGAIVDAGNAADELLEVADDHGLNIEYIWQTHAHVDHVMGLNEVKEQTDADIYLHEEEMPIYEAIPRQGQMFGLNITLPEPPQVDVFVEEGETLQLGNLEAEVFHLPGHSPGSIGFYFADEDVIFSGDVLFEGSIGRTDIPGADPEAIKRSLNRLKKFPDETRVLSGHGGETTIGREKKANPFLR